MVTQVDGGMGGAVGTMWVAGRRAGRARAAADAAAVPSALHLPVTVTGEDSASDGRWLRTFVVAGHQGGSFIY